MNELNDKFKSWNPMENDYKNAEFNQYISGPGADLDAALQPAQQAVQRACAVNTGNGHVPTLIFRHLPIGMTKNAMRNMCSRHGSVKQVRDSTKNDYFFVDTATIADMEAIFRALENNNYGFEVLVGSNKRQQHSDGNKIHQNIPIVPRKENGVDYENRNYRTSQKNHPRPKVKEESLLNAGDIAHSGLPMQLLGNDVHSLERKGLYKMQSNNKFSYRHGCAHVSMPEKTTQFIEKKSKESSGDYSDVHDKYVHTAEVNLRTHKFAKCSMCYYACDTVCERCFQYYCSVECQQDDWPTHRYICGKPKHLQQTPPSKTPPSKTPPSKTPPSKTQPSKNNYCIEAKKTKEKETVTEIIIGGISVEEFFKSYGAEENEQNPSGLKISKELSSSSKTSLHSSADSYQQLSTLSKPSSKRLPAALRLSIIPTPKASEEPSQHIATSSKPLLQQLSSAVSQSNSNKNVKNNDEIYKQNMPRSGNIVTITAISKTNIVFIRSTTYNDNLSYFHTVDSLQSLRKLLQPLKTLPKSGEVVIAKFEEQYYRALVLKVFDPNKISLHFMDHGNMEVSTMETLFEAPKELAFKPRHAIPVFLKDVTDCYMTQEIRKFMHTYLNNIKVEIRYKPEDFRQDNNIFAVELIDENTQQNLNKLIIKLATPVEPQNVNEICEHDYLEKKLLPVGRNVELIVMDNSLMCSGCVSCTSKPYAIEIEKFQKDIQAYALSIPDEPYTPRIDELCIARYSEDGLWYRGLCLETVGDGYPSIHFIDYGNITTVPINSIRRYPRQFTYPMYTFDCEIQDVPQNCDEELVAKLEELIPNGELIKCENVTVDEESNFYTLVLPDIVRQLNIN